MMPNCCHFEAMVCVEFENETRACLRLSIYASDDILIFVWFSLVSKKWYTPMYDSLFAKETRDPGGDLKPEKY